MMKKIKILLIAAASLQCIYSHAQNPGVMGRKLSVHAGLNPGVYLDDYVPHNDWYDVFRLSPVFGVQYVSGRKTSFGLSYSSFKKTVEVEPFAAPYKVDMFTLKSRVITLDMKRFLGKRDSYIAPIGVYYGFMLSHARSQLMDDSSMLVPNKGKVTEQSFFLLGFEVGKQNVYFNRLIWDFAIQGSLRPALPAENTANAETLMNHAKYATETSVRQTMLLSLRMGVGFLIY